MEIPASALISDARPLSVFLNSAGLLYQLGKGQIGLAEINKRGVPDETYRCVKVMQCPSHTGRNASCRRREGTDLQLEVRFDGCETVAVRLTGFRPVRLTAGGRDR